MLVIFIIEEALYLYMLGYSCTNAMRYKKSSRERPLCELCEYVKVMSRFGYVPYKKLPT